MRGCTGNASSSEFSSVTASASRPSVPYSNDVTQPALRPPEDRQILFDDLVAHPALVAREQSLQPGEIVQITR